MLDCSPASWKQLLRIFIGVVDLSYICLKSQGLSISADWLWFGVYKTELFVLDVLPVLIPLTVGTPFNVSTCFLSFDTQFQWSDVNNLTVEFSRFKIFLSLMLKPLLPKETLHGGFTILFHLSCASRWQPT